MPTASQYFRGDQSRFDLLQLVDVKGPQAQADLLAQLPTDQVTDEGVLCDVYRWTEPAAETPLQVEAVVAAADQTLRAAHPRSYAMVGWNR